MNYFKGTSSQHISVLQTCFEADLQIFASHHGYGHALSQEIHNSAHQNEVFEMQRLL